mmetsp:Transcript_20173/g.60167  ORF Transcript_20173/g.60167 Transcript_20173/m.60167 type:complete len:109 (-) Transcript_20173:91-417(-)|eukprot:CAMPEP_0119272328 /NCGR_PEP_ID=MMETSP1329-20130426/8552_1 /TAXON_ID=114041 /ORGANISM="Genus nov. species nov., Strain RCC1024" /LENGTH=108 /DNA_ID=CAMNT_0007272391 /DNA_START=265 /DNA_END=591 /DNA_ORIENTATION=-
MMASRAALRATTAKPVRFSSTIANQKPTLFHKADPACPRFDVECWPLRNVATGENWERRELLLQEKLRQSSHFERAQDVDGILAFRAKHSPVADAVRKRLRGPSEAFE